MQTQIGDRVRCWYRGPNPSGLDGKLGTVVAVKEALGGEEATIILDDQPDHRIYLCLGALEGYRIEPPAARQRARDGGA